MAAFSNPISSHSHIVCSAEMSANAMPVLTTACDAYAELTQLHPLM